MDPDSIPIGPLLLVFLVVRVSVLIHRDWQKPMKHRVHWIYICSSSGGNTQVLLLGQEVLYWMM